MVVGGLASHNGCRHGNASMWSSVHVSRMIEYDSHHMLSSVGSSQGEFLLAFARRNVSIDVVLAAAAARGFQWEIREEEDQQAAVMEPIYSFRLRKDS